jgi:hypothetical protein
MVATILFVPLARGTARGEPRKQGKGWSRLRLTLGVGCLALGRSVPVAGAEIPARATKTASCRVEQRRQVDPEPEPQPIESGAQSRWIKPLSCYERRETTVVEGLRYG